MCAVKRVSAISCIWRRGAATPAVPPLYVIISRSTPRNTQHVGCGDQSQDRDALSSDDIVPSLTPFSAPGHTRVGIQLRDKKSPPLSESRQSFRSFLSKVAKGSVVGRAQLLPPIFKQPSGFDNIICTDNLTESYTCATLSMDQQVRDFISTSCPVPITPDSGSGPGRAAGSGHGPSPGPVIGPSPGPSGLPTPAAVPAATGSSSSRILSRNANGTTMTSQPTNESELQLYRVLQRANLLSYYDTFICQGGDDVQQLCEAGEEEFLEIMALVGMASKPLHVRRLQKALQEWVNNPDYRAYTDQENYSVHVPPLPHSEPKLNNSKSTHEGSAFKLNSNNAMFQTPLLPAVPPSHSPYPVSPGPPVVRGPLNLSQSSPVASIQPSPPMPVLSNSNSQSSPSPGAKDSSSPQPHSALTFQQALGEYPQNPGSPTSLTPILVDSQIQRLSEAADLLVKTLPPFDPKPQNYKKKICKDLEFVMNMPEDDPRRMDEIRKYAAIYGRFDCKRKPEKPLTLHEVSVNEAAAQICKHIPALLTRRDELFPLARQVVRDSGYQYSKGHSRSQCYSKNFDEDSSCKRLRFDGSPGSLPDPNQMEEERKRRQDRLEAVTEQIKLLAGQQHDLKTGLQQSRDTHNVVAVGQIQNQLDLLANQHYQLINEQSELSRQLRRLDRYFTEYRYGIRSSCSENDKIDTDDTDSQFSVYSYESSASIGHDANESPSHDSNMSVQTNDGYTGIKSAPGKKANSHITKQLVQETLIDEGLRVVKELANQIKDETDMNHVSVPKPEGRPRGRPPKLERDYILTTAGSTTPKHYNNDLHTNNNMRNATTPVTPIQNGHSPVSVGVPSDHDNMLCHNGMVMNLRSNNHINNGSTNSNDGNHSMSDMQDDVMSNESESSLKALLAFSQKGIKQEPSSPTSIKMD
ncbi:hypothetical protein JTE90_021782 [Oedothorax gibbosus]|uniref:NGFI-A-binding protein 1 n=1 Tax=Oedothorax gibbosus TaxID=931172 RepID=A0AAV6UQB2_9ARAC|nr:hypothetical protein JTE90_021782 [Oedothorax gibbosus]